MARARSYLGSQSRARRELLIFLIALAFGLLVMPLLIWFAGSLVLGPYENGGAWALIGDFLSGLLHGSLSFWVVALGPYVFIVLARLALALSRRAS